MVILKCYNKYFFFFKNVYGNVQIMCVYFNASKLYRKWRFLCLFVGGNGGRGSHCDIRIRVNCTLLGVGILSLSRLIEISSEHDIKKNIITSEESNIRQILEVFLRQ
jgi:hypothetical protein